MILSVYFSDQKMLCSRNNPTKLTSVQVQSFSYKAESVYSDILISIKKVKKWSFYKCGIKYLIINILPDTYCRAGPEMLQGIDPVLNKCVV